MSKLVLLFVLSILAIAWCNDQVKNQEEDKVSISESNDAKIEGSKGEESGDEDFESLMEKLKAMFPDINFNDPEGILNGKYNEEIDKVEEQFKGSEDQALDEEL